MDPQVNAALAVFERRVAEVMERARHDRPNLAIGAPRYAIKLIRNKGKGDVVGAVEPFQDSEHGGAKRGVPGGIGWEVRREIHLARAGVAGLRSQGCPVRVAEG